MVGAYGIGLAASFGTLGMLLVAAAVLGRLPSPEGVGFLASVDQLPLRLALAVGGFLGALVLTGWPVVAVYSSLSGMFLPTLLRASRERRAATAKTEAIATWAESLRDTMAASAGMQEALRVSSRVAPTPIQTEVRDLVLRLQHQSVAQSLRSFAAEMDHPLSDMIVASLLLASSRRAGSLGPVLSMAAKAARDTAAMYRQVEASRARTYNQSRMAAWISFGIIGLLLLTRREFLEPYDSVGGQIALVFVGGLFFSSGLGLFHLRRLVKSRRPLKDIEHWSEDRYRVSSAVALP